MTKWRKALIGAFISVFVVSFALASLGGAGLIPMAPSALNGFFATIISQLVAAVLAAFRAKDFFKDDPFCIARIQKENAEAMAKNDAAHAAAIAEHEKKYRELEARFFQRPAPQQVKRGDYGLPEN